MLSSTSYLNVIDTLPSYDTLNSGVEQPYYSELEVHWA